MKKIFALLLALACSAEAQTYITVTADTNRVIRTNFSLVRSQISDLSGATFAISNITGLQTALDGKLATNGNAFALTNFPSLLLRTNGDGSGLTNLPAPNLTNAVGTLAISKGGTGQTNAALAIEALLPAYTNNANKILALNSNATSLIWTTNAGGGTNTNVGGIVNLADTTNGVTNTLGVFNGGTGGTNRESALGGLGVFNSVGGVFLFTNSSTISNNARHIVIGYDVYAPATNSDARGVAIGDSAYIEYGGVAVGKSASTDDGVSLGDLAYGTGKGIAIGSGASVYGGSRDPATNVYGGVAIGWGAVSYTNEGAALGRSAATYGGGAIGEQSFTRQGASIGLDTVSSNGIAGGLNAWTRNGVALGVDARTTNGVQLLTGTNTQNDTVQLLSAGSVDTNEWSALANSSAGGRYAMTNTNAISGSRTFVAYNGTNYTTNTVTFSNGIITGWTP